MKISCPTCSAKYSIADDKVQDRLAKIRCRKCGATIVIDGKTSPPNVYASASDGDANAGAAAAGGGAEYSVDLGEGDQRTMSTADIVQAYNAGQITGDTYVWAEGFSDWQPLAEVSDLVDALNAAASRVSATSRQPSPWSAPPPEPERSPPAYARPAAARSPARPAASDLFGGINTAGNEDEVATSAPEQLQSAAGARNESSVLFSLSALTSAAQHSRPSTRPQPAVSAGSSREDSGLIDLKALTAAATQAEAAAPMMAPAMAPLGAPPLGAVSLGLPGPTLGGLAGSADIAMPQKSKTPLLIGGGLTVGLLAVAAAILLKPEPPPPPPPAPVVTMPAAPPPAPTPAATDPEPPATSETAPGASADKKAPRAGRRYSGGGKKPPAKSESGAAAAGGEEKKAPPKKTSNCGCAADDLQCFMRCAAKGG